MTAKEIIKKMVAGCVLYVEYQAGSASYWLSDAKRRCCFQVPKSEALQILKSTLVKPLDAGLFGFAAQSFVIKQ
jgi:hypothetical protein